MVKAFMYVLLIWFYWNSYLFLVCHIGYIHLFSLLLYILISLHLDQCFTIVIIYSYIKFTKELHGMVWNEISVWNMKECKYGMVWKFPKYGMECVFHTSILFPYFDSFARTMTIILLSICRIDCIPQKIAHCPSIVHISNCDSWLTHPGRHLFEHNKVAQRAHRAKLKIALMFLQMNIITYKYKSLCISEYYYLYCIKMSLVHI